MELNYFVAKKSTAQSVDLVNRTWQELQNDYRTLIGVTIDKSDVNLPSKISKEEQKNV